MEDGIFFNQSKYIKEMLKKFGLEDSKPTKMPMSMKNKLTKDDEADSVDSSKYRENPKPTHLESVKGIFRYVKGTTLRIMKQTTLAISMTEAEYVSIGKACQQALWMKQALIDYDIRLDDIPIMCDNKSAIDLSKSPIQHSRIKHIEIRHHFLRDNVQKGNISIEKVASEDNIGVGVSMEFDDTMNEDTHVGVASTVKEGVTPSVVDMMVEKEKICSLEDTTNPKSFPTLTTPVTNTAGNAPGKSLYANITSKLSGKKVNVCTLFARGGNGIDVVVSMDSIRAISEPFANTAYGFFLGKNVAYLVVANYVRNTWGKYGLILSMFSSSTGLFSFQFSSMNGLDAMLENGPWSSYARVMIELRADVELKDNIVMVMPKITREGYYTCNVHVEYEWKPPRCSSCKVFGHIHEECPKNTGASEKNTMKKPSQTSRGVPSTVGSSGNKKKGSEPIIEVSNSNPFDVLNSVDNDVEFGTNEGTTNLVNNGATSSGSLFMHVDNIDKEGNPLKKVEFPGEDDTKDEVASVDNDMAHSLAYERGFGTQSLLEQWRDLYGNGDYDDDPYDDDMYEGRDLSHELQSICDNLDIHVRGRKKK
ncbi:hypothetical protein Tco_1283805 [Tanacetum coccineum]